MIDGLPLLAPDAERTERTAATCRAKLARRRRRNEMRERVKAQTFPIERALVTGISVVYLIALAADLLRLYQ